MLVSSRALALLACSASLFFVPARAAAQLIAAGRGVIAAPTPMVGDELGVAVAIAGDLLVVGSDRDTGGLVYVLERSGRTWAHRATLQSDDVIADDGFGRAVATDGTRIVVGAQWDDAPLDNAGSVYVFVRGADASAWTEEVKLTYASPTSDTRFGASVAIDGDRIVVGCPGDGAAAFHAGGVFVYRRAVGGWAEEGHLTGSGASSNDLMGEVVAIDGTTIAAGASLDGVSASDEGTVYVWTLRGGMWTEQARLVAPGAIDGTYLGSSVDLDGDVLIAGATWAGVFVPALPSGLAHVFTRSGTTWSHTATLAPVAAGRNDLFGASVSIAGDVAIVGAPGSRIDGRDSGSAYYYLREGGVWGAPVRLPVGLRSGECGAAVAAHGTGAIEGTDLFVGCPGEDAPTMEEGVVRAYQLQSIAPAGTPCAADAECTTALCIDGVCCATECGFGDPGDCEACSVAAGAAVDGTCGVVEAGRACREPIDPCDAREACDGASRVCPTDGLLVAGTECRASSGPCDPAEQCDGARAACPVDALELDGTPCGDGLGCNGEEQCAAGVCTAGLPMTCDDDDACTMDACVEPGTCRATVIEACCAEPADCEAVACMIASCDANRCAYASDPACTGADAGTVMPPTSPPAGCACSTTSAPVGSLGWLGLALAALAARRRQVLRNP